MEQTAITISLDNEVRTQFDALCRDFGMSMETAFNVFARAVVRSRRIPFEIRDMSREEIMARGRRAFNALRAQAARNGLGDMTLEEINAEIAAVRNGK